MSNLEIQGTVASWDGKRGYILTDAGERVHLVALTLKLLGFGQEPHVGDRVYFLASKTIQVSYSIQAVRRVLRQEADPAELTRLRKLNRAIGTQRGHDVIEGAHLTGVVESYDAAKGYGYIRAYTGEQVLLHVTCLRACGYPTAQRGSIVSFAALERPKGWQAFRIYALQGGKSS